MTPDEVLKQLKAATSARCHRTLDAIYVVCQEQAERGLGDFSYATIARLGDGRGVPKAQSIRNKTGEHYRALIKTFADSPGVRKPPPRPKSADSWIEEIKDPKLKLLVSVQASELRDAKRMIKEIIPPNLEIRVDDRNYARAEHRLTEPERRALEYLVSEEFLYDFKFKRGSRGEITNGNDERVFKPGTLDALRKALEYL